MHRFQSVKYNLRCLVASSSTSDCVARIKYSESQLAEKKSHLETFQSEFCDIKKKYEEACGKLEKDINETQELISQREQAYNEFVAESASKYAMANNVMPALASAPKKGLMGKIFGWRKKKSPAFQIVTSMKAC